MNHQKIQNQIATDIPTGKLPFRMASDILFKILMQSSTKVLKGIVCSYLDLSPEIIKSIEISNPISLKEDISGKEMILDVKAILNDKTIINLEMQVVNYQDRPVYCKIKLPKVAKQKWTLLQVQIGQSCKGCI